MQLSALAIYPLKSGAGIPLDRATLTATGLMHDRRFMLVDRNGDFVTLRGHPKLVRIMPTLAHDTLTLALGDDQITLPLESAGEDIFEVQIWGDYVDAVHVSRDADTLCSKYLGKPVKLVRFDEPERRQVDPSYAKPGDSVHFADMFPLLVCGTASLAAVSERLGADVAMTRFRPNLVIATTEPFIEDRWRQIRVGNIPIDIVKPCARCVGVNVDPDTARVTKEPLATLAKFRTIDREGSSGPKVMFGQNAVHRAVGQLSIGDPVAVVQEV